MIAEMHRSSVLLCKKSVRFHQKRKFQPDFGVYEAKMGFSLVFLVRLNSTLFGCRMGYGFVASAPALFLIGKASKRPL
jgi:hypothetical protein